MRALLVSSLPFSVIGAVIGPLALLACSSAAPVTPSQGVSSTAWTCGTQNVPNGASISCTSASALATPDVYVCVPGTTDSPCPPADVDAGAGCTDPTGATCDGGYTFDDDGGPVGQGGADAGTPPSGGGYSCDDDAGTPTGAGAGSGHGNGNGGANGNGGNPHDDAGSAGASCGSSSGGSSGGGGYTSGGEDAGSPGWNCQNGGDAGVTCSQPPSCQPGSHASACGACVPNSCSDDCVPPSSGGCWVTGGGWITDADGTDSFGGNAMPMKAGDVRGEWEDVDHATGNKGHGAAQYIYCRHVDEPGPGQPSGPSHHFDINQVYFGGPARWFTGGTWSDGYWFDVMAEDHGEGKGANAGGPDYYHFTIRQIAGNGVSGAVVYDTENNMSGGNIQIHPPNNGHPYAASALPPWVALQP